jgi:hypothetical protein
MTSTASKQLPNTTATIPKTTGIYSMGVGTDHPAWKGIPQHHLMNNSAPGSVNQFRIY